MKKKVLFMVINMNIGGTEKALLNMISEMPREEYEITILMLEKKGEFLNSIPGWVNIEYLKGYRELKSIINDPPKMVIKKFLRQAEILKAIIFLFIFFISIITKERSLLFKFLLRNYSYRKEYDVAVAYAGPMDFISFFVANIIKAKKKIQWIHFDVSHIGFNHHFASKIYQKFDQIYVVSKQGKDKLCSILPNLKDKTKVFLNITNHQRIRELANQGRGFQDSFNGIRILTVGRLSIEKGQDLTIPVLAKLKKEGFNVRWYCIGEGKAKVEYEKEINKYKVMDDFILLGSNPNPYSFMKQCDIYVQPSRHEGYCITLAEAKCFTNPIICTNFTGASEQITHGKTGLIIEGNSQQLYEAIKKILIEKSLQKEISKNLNNEIELKNSKGYKISVL